MRRCYYQIFNPRKLRRRRASPIIGRNYADESEQQSSAFRFYCYCRCCCWWCLIYFLFYFLFSSRLKTATARTTTTTTTDVATVGTGCRDTEGTVVYVVARGINILFTNYRQTRLAQKEFTRGNGICEN